MADVNAEIGVNIDTSNALAQLKALQREIARFHASVAKSSEAAALAQRDLQKNFLNGINAIQGFSAELRTVKTTAEGFSDSLERNKFSMREYFRYSMASTKTFGRFFKSELDTVSKVAEEGVKRLQTQYIKMGRDASGAMKAIAVMPTKLNLNDFATQTQLAAQKQAIFNQLVKQGSTNLLNFGKNTQWAGRQLMVGFTIPLIGLGTAASRTFMDMETAAIKFKKVYGDLFTATEERNQALKDIEELGSRFTKYGIALADTVGLAAEAAAAGFKGIDLQRQVTEATRLQVLGQIEQQKALETTISLQNAFRLSSADLADSINFLNAVENQTVVSLDDITTAIPKAAPIIRELGGDVKDLAFFMAAMKEGGINASEGANALKSGLASLINPSDKARAMLSDFGIDIDAIVNKNAGNVKQTVVDFAVALDDLSSLSRQRAIEQLFGKFQQARLSALFDNVIRDGNQASRVLDLAGTSTEELAALAEQELGITANSSMNKFRKSVEDLKAALVPVGQLFLEIVTPFLENIGNILDKFNDLSAGTKKVIGILTIGLGAIAPVVLMTVGLFANFVANGIKGLMLLRNGYLRLTGQSQILSEQTNFLTVEQQQALAAAASLEQSHMRLQQVFTGEAASVRALIAEYQRMIAAQNMAATRFPGMMIPGFKPQGYKNGGEVFAVPGSGNQDTVPAMLTPGEIVIPKEQSSKYLPLIQGIIADNIPGYKRSNLKTVAERTQNVPIYPDIAVRFQSSRENQSQLASVPGLADVLGPLSARIGEARGLGFGPEARSQYPDIIGQYTELVQAFLARVEASFNANAESISNESERLAVAWQTAGRETEQEIAAVSSQTDQNVIRQALGIDPDSYGTIAANFRASHGFGGRTGRYPEGDIPTSYTDPAFKRAAGQAYEMISGEAPTGMDIGHIFDLKTRKKLNMPTTVPLEELRADANIATGAIRELERSISQAEQDLANRIEAAGRTVENAGVNIGQSVIDGIAQGTQSASPSQKAKQQGQNVADGFEQGLLEGMDDASLAGQKLSDAANQGIGLSDLTTDIRYTQGTLPGLNVSSSAENLTESLDDLDNATIQAADTTANSGANLAKWNNRLMSTSFALSSISGVAMAFGNNLGGLGDKVFKVSSAMFALQGVIQLLTSTKLLQLAADRIALAQTAVKMASGGGGIAGYGLAARGGLIGSIGKIGVFARTLLGLTNPIGITIGLITAGIVAYKIINSRIEANRKKIDGLGNAALIAGKKLETLEQFFGTDFKRFTSEGFKYDENTAAGVGLVAARRQQAEALIANKDFQKDFKDTIDALRNATTSEARLVLEGISMQLQARGATKEQIQTITDALIKEAGKTDIVLDFAKIDINTKEGQAELKKNVDQILKGYNKAFAKGINDSYKRTLNLAGKSIAGTFGALQLQLEDGSISAKEYAAQIANINTQILAMPDSQAKLNLVNAVFDAMGEDAAKAAAGVTNLNNKLLLAQAIMLGVADAQSIKNLSSPLFFVQDIGARTLSASIDKYFKQLTSGLEDLNKGTNDNNKGSGKGITLQEKLIKIYEKQKTALEKKLKAMRDVNDEMDRQNEFAKTQLDLDKQIVEAKMSGNYLEAALLEQEKQANEAQFNRETQERGLEEQINKIEERISQLEKSINAKTKIVLTAAEKRLLGIEEIVDKKAKGKSKGNGKGSDKDKDNKDGATSKDLGTGTTEKNNKDTPPAKTSGRPIPKPKAENTVNPTGGFGTDFVFDTLTGKWGYKPSINVKSTDVKWSDYNSGKKTTYADGGLIRGPGTGTSDSIFAMVDGYASGGMIRVSNGEYIFSKKAIDNAGGPKAIDAMHQRLRKTPVFRDGGLVGKSQPGDMANLDGQMVRINRGTPKQILADIRAAYAAEPNVRAFKDRIDYFKAIKEWDNKYSFVIPSQKSYPIAGEEHPLGSLSRFISVAKSQAAGGSYNAFYDATLASHAFKFFSPQVDRQVKDLLDSSPSEVFNRLGEIENLNKFSIASNKAYKLGNDLIAWCGAFVAWVAEQSGVNISKKMFSAFGATQEYKDLGTFKDPGSSLNVGDVVWWDWAKKFAAGSSKYKDATPGVPDHVDIITDKIGKSTFTTVGGGFGGSVGKRNINFSKEAQALYGSVTPKFASFKDGGEVKGKNGWLQKFAKKLSGMPAAEMFGTAALVRKLAGMGQKGDALSAALLPLNFAGFGLGNIGGTAFRTSTAVASGLSKAKVAGQIGQKKKYRELIKSIYQRKDLDVGGYKYPSYSIGADPERIVFQGPRADLSEVSKAGIRVVPTNPFGILKEAIRRNPKDKSLQQLLKNFEEKKIGKEETLLIDNLLAASTITKTGKVSGGENPDAFAMILASLLGDANATKILNAKREILYQAFKNKAEQAKEELLGYDKDIIAKGYLEPGPIDMSSVSVIHSTKFPVIRNSDGTVSLYPKGHFEAGQELGVPRASIHTTLEAPVQSHLHGQWGDTDTRIISPLSSVIADNDVPHTLRSDDTWWMKGPGEALKMTNASIVRSFNDAKEYSQELIKRGLIKEGEKPPVIIEDPKTKEVLYAVKKDYTDEDRLEIAKIQWESKGPEYKVVPKIERFMSGEKTTEDFLRNFIVPDLLGKENSTLAELGLKFAKRQVGIDTPATSLAGWQLADKAREDHIRRIAIELRKNSSKPIHGAIHTGSPIEFMEKRYLTQSFEPMGFGYNKIDDSIEAARMAALHGNFHTGIRPPRSPFSEMGAMGGYVTRRGILPNFAMGGYVNLASLPKFKTGISNVPYDMPAILHKNERVLTAEENKRYGETSSTINATFNITGGNSDEIVNKVMVKLNTLNNKNNKSNRVII